MTSNSRNVVYIDAILYPEYLMRNNKFFMFTQPLTMSYSLFTTKAEKVVLENEN